MKLGRSDTPLHYDRLINWRYTRLSVYLYSRSCPDPPTHHVEKKGSGARAPAPELVSYPDFVLRGHVLYVTLVI